jgi:hypothetical protein
MPAKSFILVLVPVIHGGHMKTFFNKSNMQSNFMTKSMVLIVRPFSFSTTRQLMQASHLML